MATKLGEWVKWSGGPCPVRSGAIIQCRYRSGYEGKVRELRPAGTRDEIWAHHCSGLDIVEYRS